MRSRFTLLGCLASLSLAAFPFACGAPDTSPSQENARVGTLEAALSAVGPDGATYSLQQGTFLQLINQGAYNGVYFNTQQATQTFSLPAGSWTANLFTPNGTTTGWQLNRAADGGTSSVPATYVDTNPYSFTIAAGQTTGLVFHFNVGGVGPVTFTSGSLATSLQVDAGTSPAKGGALAGTATYYHGNYNGSAAFNSLMSVTTTTTSNFTMSLTLTGPFTMNPDQACAPFSATMTATSSHAGVQANLNELSGGTGQICIGDANQNHQVQITVNRAGTPNTAALKAVLTTSSSFYGSFIGTSPTPLFDGTTLSLQKLSGAVPLTLGSVDALLYIYDGSGNILAGTYGTGNDSDTLAITP